MYLHPAPRLRDARAAALPSTLPAAVPVNRCRVLEKYDVSLNAPGRVLATWDCYTSVSFDFTSFDFTFHYVITYYFRK